MCLNHFFSLVIGLSVMTEPSTALDEPLSGTTNSQPVVEVERAGIGLDLGEKRVPKWSGGALVVVEETDVELPVIHVFGRDGTLLSSVRLAIPQANRIIPRAFAQASDGTLAVAGSAYTGDLRGAQYLAVVSGDGPRQHVIRMNPFGAFAIEIAPDGAIWMAGVEREKGEELNPNHKMIRHFNASRELLGAYIPRSSLPSNDLESPVEDSFLVSSRDRIGWYSNLARIYIEFSLDGRVLTRVAGVPVEEPDRVTGFGLCDDGGVFASAVVFAPGAKRPDRLEVYALNRGHGSWELVLRDNSLGPGGYGSLLGCDSSDLVMLRGGELRFLRPANVP